MPSWTLAATLRVPSVGKALEALLAIASAIIGLAILSVIISRQSQTPDVIAAGSNALSKVIRAAVNPVATSATNGNLGANTFASPQESFPDFFSWLAKPPF